MREVHIEFKSNVKLELREELVIVFDEDSHGTEIKEIYVVDTDGDTYEIEWMRWRQHE